jgi:transcriptional regulator with PAS, ATPase and Fis domain
LESELFGYEKGAFTGATQQKPGKFELAHGGTFFMDEVGDISPLIQVKLLRVLQEKEFERLGGMKTIQTDVRIIAATHRDLAEQIKKGEFREDLYYRLNVVPITIPPLRDRKEDIENLINYFLSTAASISERPQKRFSQEALAQLIHYAWPGNIRELQNIIERCVVITPSDLIQVDNLPTFIVHATSEKAPNGKLVEVADWAERDIIIQTLKECEGNRTSAAKVLGISRRSLHRKINKYNIID